MKIPGNHFSIFQLLLFCIFVFVVGDCIAQTGTVRGRIGNGENLLPGATVILGNQPVITNIRGEFHFSIKPGQYQLSVSYAGYKKFEEQIVVEEGNTQNLEITLQPAAPLENVIIVGSRSHTVRSNLYTPVPVDILNLPDLPARQVEVTKLIGNYVPSFNAAPHGYLSGRHMVPASLRGLGPDQSLVLVNNRRLHPMASPWTAGVVGFGAVGTDLNAIPNAAIEKIEILRDGAAAQYGSDAIAGVIHLRLKESVGITSIQLNAGQYYEGDGETFSFSVNRGFRFMKKGFINLTGQFRFNNYTQRTSYYDSTVYYRMSNNYSPAQKDSIMLLDNQRVKEKGFDRWNHRPLGDNQVWNGGIAVNGGYPIDTSTTIFWTGVWNYRLVKDRSSNMFRYPRDSTNQIIMKLYPNGFLPRLQSVIPDLSLTVGIKGKTSSGWYWDAGSVFGQNSHKIEVTNTNNATQYLLGDTAPTRFYTGQQLFSQLTTNMNLSRQLTKLPTRIRSMHLALGAEWRLENYRIRDGEEASWKNYAPTTSKQPGAQGLAGFQPENAVDESRNILGLYTQLETMISPKLLVDLAARYEYFTDYGGSLAGKLAFLFKISGNLNWRGSVSNGFRAPSLQQRYYSLVTSVARAGGLVRNGTFRNDGAIARAFGIASLQPEKAINISSGFTSRISGNLSVTVDGYWIQIKDRIIYSGNIPDSLPEVKQILQQFQFNDVQSARFFSNAINTRTMGLDIVIDGHWRIGKSILETSLAANISSTEIYGAVQYAKNLPDNEKYRNLLVNREERCRVEESVPQNKIILNLNYKSGRWAINPSLIRYGKVSQRQNNLAMFPDQTFSPKVIVSLNTRYQFTHWLFITAGAENLFNTYPDQLESRNNSAGGLILYSHNFTPFGCNGGYYYLNVALSLK